MHTYRIMASLLTERTQRAIAVILFLFMLPNYYTVPAIRNSNQTIETQGSKGNFENGISDKPSYLLNAPLSFGAGFLGTIFGMTAAALVGIPILAVSGSCKFSLSGHSTGGGGCTEAGYNTQNAFLSIGGILGASASVHYVSKWLGLKHKWWQTLMGATIGIIPFSYFYYNVQRGRLDSIPTGGSENPHLDYGIVSVVLSTMLFTYLGSLYHEYADPVSKVEIRPTGMGMPEIYSQLGYRLRF